MKKNIKLAVLAAIVVLQLGLVARQIVRFEGALASGEEIRLRIGGYDPVDPFRGRYLQFSLTDVRQSALPSWLLAKKLSDRDCWLKLAGTEAGYHVVESASLSRKVGKGWIEVHFDSDGRLIPPVSRFYLNEEDAPRGEALLRNTKEALVTVKVERGTILVTGLVLDGTPIAASLETVSEDTAEEVEIVPAVPSEDR